MLPIPPDSHRIFSLPALPRRFYQRPTPEVAKDVLGKVLVRFHREGRVAVRLTEVEAYLGPEDPACHTFGGRRTPRVQTMWGSAGHAYVYLVYGVHHCLNLVTVGPGAGEAVLVRAAIPVLGHGVMRRRRGASAPDRGLCNGPGKLCQALAIIRADDGHDLCSISPRIYLVDDGVVVSDEDLRRDPRVGVNYAGDAAQWPLRFSCDIQPQPVRRTT